MSRVGKVPLDVPSGVDLTIDAGTVVVKGPNGTLEHRLHEAVELVREGQTVHCKAREGVAGSQALSGTTRALLGNMVTGVSQGFEKKLELVGVGYRAQMRGSSLSLSLGFSHPVSYEPPAGVSIETPTQTEILVKGVDKQQVGQAAAVIRAFRPPEPYKGKGVKYAGEQIVRKEAKKK